MQLNVFNGYTYTLETIIQAGQKGIVVVSVPIRTNPQQLRPSRLVKGISNYVTRSLFTILRIFMLYRPLKFFLFLGAIPFGAGFALGVRWLIFFFLGQAYERTRIPSLILAAILILLGFQIWIFGLIADIMGGKSQNYGRSPIALAPLGCRSRSQRLNAQEQMPKT